MSLKHVTNPIEIGPVTLRNRVARSAHATRLALISFDDLTEFHLLRARGGVGLTIMEATGVHPSSAGALNMFDPVHRDGLRRMTDALRPSGMKTFMQLWHGGHHRPCAADGGPPWAPSNVPSPAAGVVPLAMTKAMIDEIVEAYGRAARLSEECGFDGVELHAAHSYLPQQFLSPTTNLRTDEYGGNVANRARFVIEVMEAIRSSVSRQVAVAIRVSPDGTVGGVGIEDNIGLLDIIEERGLADLADISFGGYNARDKMAGGMHEPTGYELATSVPIGSNRKIPVMVTGRFRTLEEADTIIRSGDADIVAMTRAHIADPDLVRKTLAGHPEQVRPCIACNQGCLAGVRETNPRLGCTVNAGAGWDRSHGDHVLAPAAIPKRVMVIGGGPAGMEAARTAALRGHQVTLVEAEPALGGQVKLAGKAPTRQTILDISLWLEQEIYRLGVDIRLSTYIEADEVRQEGVDAVIVATGSTPRMDGIQTTNLGEPIEGMAQGNVLSSWDLFLNSGRDLGRNALVIDDTGHFEAIAVTEHLQQKGLSVAFVTRHVSFAPLMDLAGMTNPALARIHARGGFTFHPRTRVKSISGAAALIAPTTLPYDAAHATQIGADTVVFVSRNAPNRELYDELQERGLDIRLVGDASSPRFLQAAIREGHVAGAEI